MAVQLKPHLILQICGRIKIKLLSLRTCVYRLSGQLKLTVNTQRAAIACRGHQSSTTNHPPQCRGQVKWGAIPCGNTCPATRPSFYWAFLLSLQCWYFFFVRLFLFVAGIFIIVVLPCNFDGWRRHKMPEWWRHQYDLPAGKCFHAARKNILGVGAMWVGGGGACASAVYVCVSFWVNDRKWRHIPRGMKFYLSCGGERGWRFWVRQCPGWCHTLQTRLF